jgi:hypothetical protein
MLELSHVRLQSFVHIIPDIDVRAAAGAPVPGSVLKEIKRRKLSRQWNKVYYQEVEHWKRRVFGSEEHVTLRFPAGGTHDFRFAVQAPARYAELLFNGRPRSLQSKPRPAVQFSALIVAEPQLRFCDGPTGNGLDTHPMRGLVQHGPYDAELVREQRCSELRLGVVAPRGSEEALSKYLRQLAIPHAAVETKAEYLVPYPGFQQVFRLSLTLPEPRSHGWRTLPTLGLNLAQPLVTQKAIIGAIEREIETLRATARTNVILVFIPREWQSCERVELNSSPEERQ